MSARVTWDDYFMRIAKEVSSRATCDRKHVGAVVVRDKSILATGYNGSIRGLPHCDEEGHLMEDGHCVRTIHAEAIAIHQGGTTWVWNVELRDEQDRLCAVSRLTIAVRERRS